MALSQPDDFPSRTSSLVILSTDFPTTSTSRIYANYPFSCFIRPEYLCLADTNQVPYRLNTTDLLRSRASTKEINTPSLLSPNEMSI